MFVKKFKAKIMEKKMLLSEKNHEAKKLASLIIEKKTHRPFTIRFFSFFATHSLQSLLVLTLLCITKKT